MDPYCESCFALFKFFDSCPRSYIFSEGNAGEIIAEIIWVAASLLLIALYIALVLWIIFGRTSRALFVLISLAVQQIINEVILKRAFAQARPLGACSTSYGLPSGHSSFAAAFFTWLVLEWFMFHEKVPFKTSKGHVALRTIGLIVLPLIPISRYFLNYHTAEQICYGVLVGCVCAIVHFMIVTAIIHRSEGKFWSITIIRILKKIKYRDNFLYYEIIQEAELAQQEDIESQQPRSVKSKMILPLRHAVQKLIWKTYIRTVVREMEHAKQESSKEVAKQAEGVSEKPTLTTI